MACQYGAIVVVIQLVFCIAADRGMQYHGSWGKRGGDAAFACYLGADCGYPSATDQWGNRFCREEGLTTRSSTVSVLVMS